MELINTNLSIKIDKVSDTKYRLNIQSFPQNKNDIENIKLIFDMKFRNDYESDFAGICVGPSWDNYGPGEFTLNLNQTNDFKNFIIAEYDQADDDGCQYYFYYLRFFEITTEHSKYLVGVATDYAGVYPDAPHIWKQNKLNQIEELGTSNIEKYSINFELSN